MKFLRQISERITQKQIVIITRDQLDEILATFKIIYEENTCFSGMIRILADHGQYLVQEESTTHEIILRGMPTEKTAVDFIRWRLETYENMWNGCGCKVNYYE